MMAINLGDLLPLIRDLVPALEEAQAEVNAETDPDKRKELIDKYRSRWVALRPHMAKLSWEKCWYTESKNPGTDDDVDHYRPKNSVAVQRGEAEHGGYYWLAFYWRNFRLSCHRGNRLRKHPETNETGGKGDQFPLLDPSKRLRTPTRSQEELDKENPLLLDPTHPGDASVITFTARGVVAINPNFEQSSFEQRRFEESRRCYHLDWPAFRDERVQLYNLIERKIYRASELAPPRGTVSRSAEFNEIVFELRRLMSQDQVFSSAARAYVSSFRSLWWVEFYVLEVTSASPLAPSPASSPASPASSPASPPASSSPASSPASPASSPTPAPAR